MDWIQGSGVGIQDAGACPAGTLVVPVRYFSLEAAAVSDGNQEYK